MRGINLFTIPAGAAFADELARGVLRRFSDARDPFVLSRALILLPTKRAIRSLSEAFARAASGGISVLPRMRALGDFDETPSPLEDPEGGDFYDEVALDLPAPLPLLRREFLLTKLILQWATSLAKDGALTALGATSPSLALKLARELGQLLDQATAEGLSWERLKTIVPQELSMHWEQTVAFLSILTEQWPKLLEAEKASDPAMHRDAALRFAAERWRASPPSFPVIAAGSTGSQPATAALLKTIAYMPNGAVVLPGVDLGLDREAWEATASGHPQHGMRMLLEKMDATRRDVEFWTGPYDDRAVRVQRSRLIAEALRPAETTPAWRDFVQDQRAVVEEGLRGLSMFVARTPAEEALAIACALRAAVETPEKTAALVTPDRNLARRVGSELRRWDITIDDSAGVPLSQTEIGRFLCLIVDAAAEDFAPVALLALLKHPLAALGFAQRAEARSLAVQFEERVLRGPRPPAGLAGLRRVVAPKSDLAKLVERLEAAYGPFAATMAESKHDVTSLAHLHRGVAELLSMEGDAAGEFWKGEVGEAALALFDRGLREAAADVGLVMEGREYAAFIRTVMNTIAVRPHFGRHARLAILGPLEARLQHPDLMILSGLNEGVWPPQTDPGPWLNRPMRRELDVSQPERRVGLSAHDFAQGAAAPEVILTRAEKDAGAPTTPSRWLTRLSMLVEGAGLRDRLIDERWLAVARALDRPAAAPQPIAPPEPRPPVAARPRKLPVTQIELWVRDPYALYVRQVLGLKKLDAIDEAPGAAERGTAIHEALDRFVRMYPAALPSDDEAYDVLIACGKAAFGEMLERPGVKGFWWPRFERVARWFLEFERARRAGAAKVLTEQQGLLTFNAPAGPFTVTAKADRIEVLADDAIAVVDYKTGGVPTSRQVATGLSPQLTLEAAIALGGGFSGVTVRTVEELIYVALKGGSVAGEVKIIDFDDATPDDEARRALAGLLRFVTAFDDPDQPYLSKPRVLLERFAGDYDHLARVKEWSSGEEE